MWIIYSLIAILLGSISDIFRKIASEFSDAFFGNLAFQVGSLTAAIVYWIIFSRQVVNNIPLSLAAFTGGFFIATFTLFSFKALHYGPGASTVLPILRIGSISLLVVFSVIFLKEQFTLVKALGLCVSLFGLYLLHT